jgi:SOS-response transcriptional repressor LexA
MTACNPRPPPEHGSARGQPTSLQLAVLVYTCAFIAARGEPPSVHELAERFGWKSPNGAADVLRRLAARGLVALRKRRHRSLRVTKDGRAARARCLRERTALFGEFDRVNEGAP